MDDRARRTPVLVRLVDVAAIETRRLEKGLTRLRLCLDAGIDNAAYLNLLRYEGRRSRDGVIIAVARVLGLAIKDIVSFNRKHAEAV